MAHSRSPASFTRLPQFATGIRGGLAGWSDSAALVAANPSSATLTDGTDTFPAGQLAITPPSNRVVAVGWTSPLSHSATVNVTGSIASADPNSCASKFTWSLEDQSGTSLQSGGAGGGSIAASLLVPAAGGVYLVLDTNGIPVAYDARVRHGDGHAPHHRGRDHRASASRLTARPTGR